MCLDARDPYCGWDRKQRRCTTIEDSSNMSQWFQNITACPLRNQTADGAYGPWAPWQPCSHDDGEGTSTCLCRSRACDSPPPRCGGKNCEGPTIEVSNCSRQPICLFIDATLHLRNGGWTPWSSWGQCSTSCEIGFEVRQRSCNNPSPRHGGRVCVGQSREQRFCNEKVSCPQPIFWSSWSPWSKCSSECGGGVHSRSRNCENGNSCPGCALVRTPEVHTHLHTRFSLKASCSTMITKQLSPLPERYEYQACNLESCPEVRRNTPWTPWVPVNITQGGARQEQRVRYICRAQLADPHELQLGKRKVETRFCPNDGTVTCETDSLVEELLKTPGVRLTGSGWSSWEMWSACTQECAKGYRTRKRTCTSAEGKSVPTACRGSPVEYQDCNPQPCPVNGAWACWSSWSQCSVPCGGGHYQRTRTCTSPTPANGGDICIGLHTEEALCNTHTCDDSEGGSWGPPGYRWCHIRVCGAQSTPCVGNSSQHRDCNEIPAILPASSYEKDQQCGDPGHIGQEVAPQCQFGVSPGGSTYYPSCASSGALLSDRCPIRAIHDGVWRSLSSITFRTHYGSDRQDARSVTWTS
ncbi:Semaphorin-5B [Labeo rohita]|uniref:Semaphorin-5B n=1 Tax=Labeo rohita TaxID=84645 RepID=A0ABQ8MD33_LABRO|nr:Semaphorin-5B [Labeo rohita]